MTQELLVRHGDVHTSLLEVHHGNADKAASKQQVDTETSRFSYLFASDEKPLDDGLSSFSFLASLNLQADILV